MRGSKVRSVGLLLGIMASGGGIAPAWADPQPDSHQFITLQGENDAVSTLKGTSDQNYTSGLRLGWTSGTDQVPAFLERMGHAVYGNEGVQRVSLDISQSIFTPQKTQLSPPDPHDRPYAGYLLVTGGLITETDNRRLTLNASLGIVGPESGAQQLQNGFHKLTGDTPNRGWDYQLRDEPAFEVRSEGVWRVAIAQFDGLETDVLPTVQLGIGNLRDYVLGGFNFRIGQGLRSDYGVARIEPGMTGGDVFTPVREFAWYIFAGGNAQGVAHDLTLDGNTWRSGGPHVSKKWYVGELTAGVGIIWHDVRFTYSQTWQTEEYNGQKGGLFNFGSLAASVRF